MAESRRQRVRELGEQLRRLEQGWRPHGSELRVSTGFSALDRLLPERGLRRGTLVEWLPAGDGVGVWTLALLAAQQACHTGGSLVVIDERREFYPPAAAQRGASLDHLIVVRPDRRRDALWALDQALRCVGVSAVLCWVERASDLVLRRMQLAAVAGGGIGLVVRPTSARLAASYADLRLLVAPRPSRTGGRRVHVEVLRCRGGAAGAAVELDIDHETGAVRLASQLAAAASV